MARFFPNKKDSSTERGHVDTTAVKKNKFNLFRRGRSEMPEAVPEPERVTTQRKTQSYRISVYEVRSESPATTCSSTDLSDTAQRDATDTVRRRSPSPKGRRGLASSPLKHIRSKSPSKSIRTDLCVAPDSVRPVPQRTFSGASGDRSADRPSPLRGILKRATYSLMPEKRGAAVKKPQPIASFDLEFARGTSLTDNMSSDHEEAVAKNAKRDDSYALGARDVSFVIHPKRTVSFSKDVRDPKPKPSGVASLCLGTRSGRRMPRRRSDFSLFHEFEDLCYDLTYFCRCFASEEEEWERRTARYYYAPIIPEEDDNTHDDSTFEEKSMETGSI